MKDESFVASTLFEMGWTLQYRATNIEGLKSSAERHPEAIIVATQDFLSEESDFSNPVIFLDLTAELTKVNLQDMLLQADKSERVKAPAIPLSHIKTTLIVTLDAGVGGSTCAINIAYEKSLMGKKILLLDLNHENPSLSQYFDMQRINRKIAPTQYGFSLSEVSEVSYFVELARKVDEFDEVVIDLGKLMMGDLINSGVRIREISARWSLNSATSILMASRADAHSLMRLKMLAPEFLKNFRSIRPTILLVSQGSISVRERRSLIEKAAAIFGGEARYLPREYRMLERAAAEKVPFSQIAPKSLLAREFEAIAQQ